MAVPRTPASHPTPSTQMNALNRIPPSTSRGRGKRLNDEKTHCLRRALQPPLRCHRLAAALVLLHLAGCASPNPTAPTRSDLSRVLDELRENHVPAEARPLYSGAFRQAWRDAPQPGFQPALAELRATDDALHVLAVLADRDIHNSATAFNERTWETGDVFEIFLQIDADTYFEFHITPENRRLFLAWTPGLKNALRTGEATLEDAMMADRDALDSETRIRREADYWTVRARIPLETVGLDPDKAYPGLRLAFARYDTFRDGRPRILSATSPFPAPRFHNRGAWLPLDW